MTDTIFALATAPGRAAVAVIRISGPNALHALKRLARTAPAPRRAALRVLRGADGAVLDQALVIWFPGPGSFTGEDSAELHLHGGRAGVEAVSAALAQAGLRLAEPGEFSRRAFQNGKLDLTQAEAIADLVDAETDSQRRQALGQLEGGLSARYEDWRARLLQALAWVEAAVDFPDEDLPETLQGEAGEQIAVLAGDLDSVLRDGGRGERIRDGFRIALLGAPNAGKSSLLNRLVGRDAAIVTPTPGATRDVIEVAAVIDGYKVIFADMAGVRESADPIEAEGVRRARAWAQDADLRLWVVDGGEDGGLWSRARELVRPGDVLALNKSDRPIGADTAAAGQAARALGMTILSITTLVDEGQTPLWTHLRSVLAGLGGADFPAVTRLRHRRHLETAVRALHAARASLMQAPELAAEDLRAAALSLGRIVGRIDAEEVLGEVFSGFCIGK